ncbi:MAG: LysR family transcriptional regulator [Hyphomicrobiaceae bacterium]
MLRCFVAVARSGNLADAADDLARTPSAVSMMLKQFEDHLGSPLFETDRKSKLTPLGMFVFEQATRELDHFERTTTAIESFARATTGFVRIAAVPTAAEVILPRVVQLFSGDHPNVQIDIRDMDSAAVQRELMRERVEIGLASGAGAIPEIARHELLSDAFGIVCRADHALAKAKRPIAWDALAKCTFIANGLCAQIDDELFQRIFADSRLMIRNTTSLLAMVRSGIGVTVLPRLVVADGDRDLVFKKVADNGARRQIEILRRSHAKLSPAAQAFEDMIRSVVRKSWRQGKSN